MNAKYILVAAALSLTAGTASAAGMTGASGTAVGLVGDATLVVIDVAEAGVIRTLKVEGVNKLLGIDMRPSNKMLYGVGENGVVVTIDPMTGQARPVAKLDTTLNPGVGAIVDFNPVADRLRFMGTDGTNLRVDVDAGKVTVDGKLAFEEADMHKGEMPRIVAAAYTNAAGKPEKTAMYDIDAKIGALIQQTKPNDGVLKSIGKLGVELGASVAFDIQTTADGKNTAWLVTAGKLHTVALDTGKATMVAPIAGLPGDLRDVTFVPAP
jgi:hypothetical protein